MDKVRVVYKPDKSIAIIHPISKSRHPGETEKQWLDRVFAKAMSGKLEGLLYDDIDKSELPQSREDRDAWEGEKGKGVSINQAKAQLLREARDNREKVSEEARELAIQSLKDKGELPPDYTEEEIEP